MLNLCLAFSLHLLPGEWNTVHPCAYWQRDGWKVGAFYNSESNVSVFAARKIADFELGLVTGYKGLPVAPMVRFTRPPFFIMPAVTTDREVGLVVGMQFDWSVR